MNFNIFSKLRDETNMKVSLVLLFLAIIATSGLMYSFEGTKIEPFLISLAAGLWASLIIFGITEFLKISFLPRIYDDTQKILETITPLSPIGDGDIEVVASKRGDLNGRFYGPIYKKADRIQMVGVAFNDLISALSRVAREQVRNLHDLNRNNILHIMNSHERQLEISAIMADPCSEFAIRRNVDGKTVNDILDNLIDLEELDQYVRGQAAGANNNHYIINGSIKIYLSQEDLPMSVFNSSPGLKAKRTAYYGMILENMDGSDCPMIAAHDIHGHGDNKLQENFELYAKMLIVKAGDPAFTWNGSSTSWECRPEVHQLMDLRRKERGTPGDQIT